MHRTTLALAAAGLLLLAHTGFASRPAAGAMIELGLEEEALPPGVTACILLAEAGSERLYIHNPSLLDSGFTPASTFKILNTLIVQAAGVAGDTTRFAWDGVDRGWSAWNRDLTLRAALRWSAVHLYQRMARQVGRERMQAELRRAGYCRRDTVRTVDLFWLNGEVRITPREQLAFLRRTARGELPYAPEQIELVHEGLLTESGNGWTARAKTGRAIRVQPRVGWYVGWIERDNGPDLYFVTLLLAAEDGPALKRGRIVATRAALESAGLAPDDLVLPYF